MQNKRVIAFDPGVNTGWAIGSEEKGLEKAGLIEFTNGVPNALQFPVTKGVHKIVVEKPVIYDRKQWKGDPNDLISVAIIGGFCAGRANEYSVATGYAEIQYVFPQDWKGGRPKAIDNKYTFSLLTFEEKEHLPPLPKSKLHNVIDAVGILLWAIGRR